MWWFYNMEKYLQAITSRRNSLLLAFHMLLLQVNFNNIYIYIHTKIQLFN